ncbi:MAG: hypothetical protein AAB152_19100 [Candidatus Coatesbacteria bacterium]
MSLSIPRVLQRPILSSAIFSLILLSAGCASTPKESVELSATIGRDLEAVHTSHRELAKLLYARMKQDVNTFVDTKYAPWQIATVGCPESLTAFPEAAVS